MTGSSTLSGDSEVLALLALWRAGTFTEPYGFFARLSSLLAARWQVNACRLVPCDPFANLPTAPDWRALPLPMILAQGLALQVSADGVVDPRDPILDLLDMALCALANARLAEDLSTRLGAIRELGNHSAARDINLLAGQVCQLLLRLELADHACLYVLEDQTFIAAQELRSLKQTITLNLGRFLAEAGPLLSGVPIAMEASGLLGEATSNAHEIVLEAPELALRWPASLEAGGLAGAIAVPVVLTDRVLGVVLAARRHVPFTSAQIDFISDLANHMNRTLLTAQLFADASDEQRRAHKVIERLHLLNAASAGVAKTLNSSSACQELLAHVSHFMTVHWQAVFLCKDTRWQYAHGSSMLFETPPDSWLACLENNGHPKSLVLPPDLLAQTPFDTAGRVILFPLHAQHRLHGLLVIATETRTTMGGMDMVETLVNHTALILNNARMMEHLERQAVTDGLTGVRNRRHFDERLHSELQRASRYGRPLSLIMLDLDWFKVTNDVLGHLGGDAILQELAQLLQQHVRNVDLVARYGGEEFALLLPETDSEQALRAAEKLRDAIDRHPFPDQERLPHRNITASLGLATCPTDARNAEELIMKADQALYAAKQAGRNAIRAASGSPLKPSAVGPDLTAAGERSHGGWHWPVPGNGR